MASDVFHHPPARDRQPVVRRRQGDLARRESGERSRALPGAGGVELDGEEQLRIGVDVAEKVLPRQVHRGAGDRARRPRRQVDASLQPAGDLHHPSAIHAEDLGPNDPGFRLLLAPAPDGSGRRALGGLAAERSHPELLAVRVMRREGRTERRPDAGHEHLAARADAERPDPARRLAREALGKRQLAQLRPVESVVRAGDRPEVVRRAGHQSLRLSFVRPDVGFQPGWADRRLRQDSLGRQ